MDSQADVRKPISGLPLALETLMETLITSFELKSWSIFNDNYGACCLKIRWKPSQCNREHNQGIPQHTRPKKYVKKSASAMARDYQRSSEYHNRTTTRSADNRNTMDSEPELPRSDITSDKTGIMQSPVDVNCSPPVERKTSLNSICTDMHESTPVNYNQFNLCPTSDIEANDVTLNEKSVSPEETLMVSPVPVPCDNLFTFPNSEIPSPVEFAENKQSSSVCEKGMSLSEQEAKKAKEDKEFVAEMSKMCSLMQDINKNTAKLREKWDFTDTNVT